MIHNFASCDDKNQKSGQHIEETLDNEPKFAEIHLICKFVAHLSWAFTVWHCQGEKRGENSKNATSEAYKHQTFDTPRTVNLPSRIIRKPSSSDPGLASDQN